MWRASDRNSGCVSVAVIRNPVDHTSTPFSIMAPFHSLCVLRIPSEDRHTCERSRSLVANRSFHPSGCVTRMQRATLLVFAQDPVVAEFNGMALLSRGVSARALQV